MTVAPIDTLTLGGRTVALAYDDPSREYAALRDACGVVRRDERARWVFGGPGMATALGGIVTNDVESLAAGSGCYAVALTAKGRIVADLRVLRRDDDYLVDAAPRAALGWGTLVRKYVNPRLAKYADVSEATSCIGLYGPRANQLLARVGQSDLGVLHAMTPYHHIAETVAGVPARVVRAPDLGVPGFDIIFEASHSELVFAALCEAGGRPVGLAAADIARVEAGRPEWGIDMDDTTIPQEANLEQLHAISFTKGCYTGQEVVARVHFRGHVNRVLRGLMSDDPLPPRAMVGTTERSDVGDVRSSVVSPRLGPIALAMLRREVAIGDEVTVRDGEHELSARVVALPF